MVRNIIYLILLKLFTTFVENYNQMNKEEINKMLFDACSNLDISDVKNAIELGADVNAIIDKNTALYKTIFCNKQSELEDKVIDTLKILLDNGANINLNVEEGASSAIFYAAYYSKSFSITKFLLDNGADINKVNKGEEWTIINYINNDLQSHFCKIETKTELKTIYDFLISLGAKESSELGENNPNTTINTEKIIKELPSQESNKRIIKIIEK